MAPHPRPDRFGLLSYAENFTTLFEAIATLRLDEIWCGRIYWI